jgi:hypothetical protein
VREHYFHLLAYTLLYTYTLAYLLMASIASTPSMPSTARCSTCKRTLPVDNFPLDRTLYRTLSCAACHARLRDSYRERKGEPVSREGRVRRFARAQRTVEKALRARIHKERIRKTYRERKQAWERGDPYGFTNRRELESFMLKDKF